jgi:4'-phosphopantetheinyl transferase
MSAADAVLSPDERFRCGRFRAEHDRRDYAAAHALLRTALSRHADTGPADWRFGRSPGGKPHVDAPHAPSFNLSHTHGVVACAVAFDLPLGVDVERIDRRMSAAAIDAVARRCFSHGEVRALGRAVRADARFCELWTLKEAFIKATGAGLSQPLNTVAFDLDDDASIRFLPACGVNAAEWRFALYAPSPHSRLAVAVQCGGRRHLAIDARATGPQLAIDAPPLAPIRTTSHLRAFTR